MGIGRVVGLKKVVLILYYLQNKATISGFNSLEHRKLKFLSFLLICDINQRSEGSLLEFHPFLGIGQGLSEKLL